MPSEAQFVCVMWVHSADCASLMTQKPFPNKPHYTSPIAHLVQMNTLSTESEAEYTPPDVDFEAPISSQTTSSVIVHMKNAPDDVTDTPRIVRSGNTPQDNQGTAVVTDSSPVVQDTTLNPSLSTDANNTEGSSENITIIEELREEIWNMRLQMAKLQKNYEDVVSSRDEASAKVVKLLKDMLMAESKIEQRDQDVKLMNTQSIKTQAKLDALEKMWKDILENQSFTSSSLAAVVRTLQTFIQQLNSSINNSTQKLDASVKNSTQTLTNLLIAFQNPAPPPPVPELPSYRAGGLQEFQTMFKEFFAAPFAFRGCTFPFLSVC